MLRKNILIKNQDFSNRTMRALYAILMANIMKPAGLLANLVIRWRRRIRINRSWGC